MQFTRVCASLLSTGFIRDLEKYGKVWNKIWSISRLEKAGKKFFFWFVGMEKEIIFPDLIYKIYQTTCLS